MSLPLTQEIQLPNGLKYEQPLGLFINGEFVAAKNGQTIETIDPHTTEPICKVHAADSEDVDLAVKAARQAFKQWKKVAGYDKAKLLHKLADVIDENREILASIDAYDAGKPKQTNVEGDIDQTIDILRLYAGWADKINGKTVMTSTDKFAFTKLVPFGVCGQIIPWNYPIAMAAWKLAPALATGNVCVLKTSEITPLSMLYFGTLLNKAGIPKGVVNILSGLGKEAGAAIASHPDVDKLAFTGSTVTGRVVMKLAANSLKSITLECGGKSPNIIFDDANFEQAVKWAWFGVMYNQGQDCSATSRIYVQEGIYDKFVEALKKEAEAYKVGSPFDDAVEQGPQISELQYNKVLDYIKKGKDSKARLVTGGNAIDSKGYYIEPTIFADVEEEETIMTDEIFGPVVCVSKFKTEEEVIEKANSTIYGLGSAVFTENISRALRVADEIEAGTVCINAANDVDIYLPATTFKQSGIGGENGDAGIQAYTQMKAYHVNLGKTM